jgi:hypothetical protein
VSCHSAVGLKSVGKPDTVTQFVEVGVAGKVDHRRRTTQQDYGVRRRRRQSVPDHVRVDEADRVLPLGGIAASIYCEPHLESVGMRCFQSLQLLSQEDVLLRLIGEQEPQLGLVILGILEDSSDQLEHWSDSGSSGDHANLGKASLLHLLGLGVLDGQDASSLILEVSRRTSNLDLVSDGHVVQVLGHLPSQREPLVLKVDFNHEVEIPLDGVIGHWSVGSNDQLVVDASSEVDVLSDRQTQDVLWSRKPEPEPTSVVRERLLRLEEDRVLGVWVLKKDLFLTFVFVAAAAAAVVVVVVTSEEPKKTYKKCNNDDSSCCRQSVRFHLLFPPLVVGALKEKRRLKVTSMMMKE